MHINAASGVAVNGEVADETTRAAESDKWSKPGAEFVLFIQNVKSKSKKGCCYWWWRSCSWYQKCKRSKKYCCHCSITLGPLQGWFLRAFQRSDFSDLGARVSVGNHTRCAICFQHLHWHCLWVPIKQ